MKTILHLNRFASHVLLACLVSLALASSVVRFWLLPRAADWREDLQADIGAMIDETVRIKSLSAGMRGFKPELMMRGFRIESAAQDGTFLEFDRLGVGLDIARSLLARKPVIDRIDLEGGRLRLFRKPDGTVAVFGLKESGPPAWLFAEGEVRFLDIDLEWAEGGDGQITPLGRAQVRLRNRSASHVLDGRLDLPGKLGKHLKLAVELEGNPFNSDTWEARAYTEVKRLREGAFAASLPVRLRSGEIGLQIWSEWKNGAFRAGVGKVDLDRPVFIWRQENGPEAMIGLDKLAGWLQWRREDSGWRMDVNDLVLTHHGRTWPGTDFAVAVGLTPDGGLQSLKAAFDYLQLNEIQNVLGSLPLVDESTRETLKAFSPRGEVRDGRLFYQADGRLGFCGTFNDVGINRVGDWPGLGSFSGRLCGNDRDGRIDFRMARTDLNLPDLFERPLVLDAASGSVEWRRFGGNLVFAAATPGAEDVSEPSGQPASIFSGSAWRIVGNRMEVSAPGFLANGGFALNLPATDTESIRIDLRAHLRDLEAARLRDYLPLKTMGEGAAKWLGEAFDGGIVKNADVLLRGNVSEFPFPNGEGLFESRVDVERMELDFSPDWPHLYDVDAKILLFGPKLFVESTGGRIGEIPLGPVHAETEDFIGDGWMGLTGNLDADLGAAMNFLKKTPLRRRADELSRVAELSGPAHLDLKLMIPMGSGSDDTGVEGALQLHNDTLLLKSIGSGLAVQGIAGELRFTEDGLEGRQIGGFALDERIQFDVHRQGDFVLVDATGKTSVPALRKTFPGKFLNYAGGDFGYWFGLQIPTLMASAEGLKRFSLVSDLAGLELKLPAPLSKPAGDAVNFRAAVEWGRGDQMFVDVAYGHEGRARLKLSQAGTVSLKGGDLVWGKPAPPSSDEPGLGVFVKLPEFDAGAWWDLIGETVGGAGASSPRALDVQVGNLLWNKEDLGFLRLTGKRDSEQLVGEVDCRYARGVYSVTLPELSHSAVRLELDNLTLPNLPDGTDGRPWSTDPANLPALKVHARHLVRQGIDLGALDLETERWTLGMNIKWLRLSAENHDLALKGSWMREAARDETRVDGRLSVRDLGVFLTSLGYRREIQFTPTDAVFSFVWGGAPHQFSPATVAGEMRLKMGRGSVLQVEPGFGRALGILNLQTLRRLLLLDFSDLFGKGLAYDRMEGVFQLRDGQASTNGLVIDAVAADILVMGKVGLVTHELDETISVVPHTLASIPLAGAIVGREAVGAVIDMARRLVGAEDANLASTNYAVTGTWDNPQFKRLEGSMALDVINRAWSNFKDFSGIGNQH